MARKMKERADKPYVFTKKDAWKLLAASSDYAQEPDRAIGGKDRGDILAEAALAQGHSRLSLTISGIHSSVMDFHKGKYKAIQYLLEEPVISERIKEAAKGTRFETAVGSLFGGLGWIAEVEDKLAAREGNPHIDWDASAKVLLNVKAEKFPENLTMVEKLALAKPSARNRGK